MKTYYALATIFLIIFSSVHAAEKSIVIDTISIKNQELVISLHADGIFDDKTVSGLNRGLTSTFQYEIQLWEKRSIWVNSLVTTVVRRIKVYFDNWEKKYVIISPEERRLTPSLKKVKKICSFVENQPVIFINELQPRKKYFLVVKLIQKPLSIQNYQEMKNWLSGSAKNLKLKDLDDSEEQERKIKGGFLKLILSLTGFGDKIISQKSSIFSIEAESLILTR